MSSLDDILNRVLSQAVDSAATKVQGAVIGRRPLRDPESGSGAVGYSNTGVFSDLQSAIRTIHDPAIAQGLRNSAARADDSADDLRLSLDDVPDDPLTSPAVRKTTLADDLGVIGTITDAGTSIVKDMAIAGKATQGLADSAGKLDRAVIDLTRSVVKATPRTSENQSPGIVGGVMNRASGFLESNSIAESVRAMVGRLRNGSDGPAGSGGDDGDGGAIGEGSFADRLSAGFDRALARSMMFFRSMSAGSGGVSRGNGGNVDGSDGSDSSPLSGRSLRTIVSQRIGRAGRRALVGAFRGRVIRGMRGLRGRGVAGGAGGTGGGWAGRIAGMPPGGMIGGGVHHGAGGGMGGGAAGGAAAAAGGMGAGVAVAAVVGLVAAFAALIAIVNAAGQAIYKLGMQGYETALRVSQYSGELNIAKAQLNVGRLMRDIQTAQDLSKSGAGMMRAIDKLEEVLRPLTTEVLSMSMTVLTKAIEELTAVMQASEKFGMDFMMFIDDKLNRAFPALFPKWNQPQNNQPQQAQPDFLGLHEEFAKRAIAKPPRAAIPPQGAARP